VRRPAARLYGLEGQNTFLGGQDFCFYYMYKTNLSGHNKVWETNNFGDTVPECTPVATGLAVRESYPQLSELAFRIFLPLPQYLCERGFSALAHIKPETRNQSKVEHEIRLAPPNTQARLSKLVIRLQSLLSH